MKEFVEEKLKALAANEYNRLTETEGHKEKSYTEETLRQYYEEHEDKHIQPGEARLACISFTDKNRAEEIKNDQGRQRHGRNGERTLRKG